MALLVPAVSEVVHLTYRGLDLVKFFFCGEGESNTKMLK